MEKTGLFFDHQNTEEHHEDADENSDNSDNSLQYPKHLVEKNIHCPSTQYQEYNTQNQGNNTGSVHTSLLLFFYMHSSV